MCICSVRDPILLSISQSKWRLQLKNPHYSSFTCFLWKSNHTSNIEIFLQWLLWISLLSHTLCLFLHLLNSPFPSQNYHLIKPNFSSLTTSPTFLSTFLSQFVGVYFPSASPTIKVIQSKHPARCVICQGDSNALFLFIFKQCLHYQYIKWIARQSLSPVPNERGLSKTNNPLFSLKATEQVYQRRVKNDHYVCCLSLLGHERDGFPLQKRSEWVCSQSQLYSSRAGAAVELWLAARSLEWELTLYKMIKA